jgi:N,N'-diacetyllegionaminate synthase
LSKVLIIAEAGVNHNGSMQLAKQLVDVAAEAGAGIVKFQSFKAAAIASKNAVKADYQNRTTSQAETQLDMLKRLELSEAMHHELIDYCKQKNIEFLSTAFDFESIELLKQLGITTGKIPSGEITNLPYLEKMAAAFPRLILSTGMCSLEEIQDAISVLLQNGASRERMTVLHCNTEYPTPFADVNLKAMNGIAQYFQLPVGYSDHTTGIEVPIAAVALGATVIEKHFTLDKTMEGPDHLASLEPHELKAMVAGIRNIEMAMAGSGLKQASASEIKNKAIARKSIVAATNIKAGDVFTTANLAVKRPGTGVSPMRWHSVIGQTAKKDFSEDELIEL